MLKCNYLRATWLGITVGYCTKVKVIITTPKKRLLTAVSLLTSKVSVENFSTYTHYNLLTCSLLMCVYYIFYVFGFFFKGRYVTFSCTVTLIFETHSSDAIAKELDRSMDVKLHTMLEILLRLPAISPCPNQTKTFRQQVSNHIQFTKKTVAGGIYG